MQKGLINLIRDYYNSKEFIPLHVPKFSGNEGKFVQETIKSTYVSSVGKYVDQFECDITKYTKSPSAVAVMNGTAALHIALQASGVQQDDLVITQALTFVATCNAIKYCGADPVFIDVDLDTLGLSPFALEKWLQNNAFIDDKGVCKEKNSKKKISACIPMHTFGHPVKITELLVVCSDWKIPIIEDAAESLGSYYKKKHTGTFGLIGTLSFNGNKIITTGGGGMVLTNKSLGKEIKHLTTTAKKPHAYEFHHDSVGYNYRMPNINAALGCAQLEMINSFIEKKRELANIYFDFFSGNSNFEFFTEPKDCVSNYWLNSVICGSKNDRDSLLKFTNKNNIMTRPIWVLMTKLPMYKDCLSDNLKNSLWLEERVVNLPSSVK
jgi:aminotransferase in exopolysaccharide biosynthesis